MGRRSADLCIGELLQFDLCRRYQRGGKLLGRGQPYGALDMAGNVWEWVNDWYSSTYYSGSPLSNPPGPATGVYRMLRGGDWSNSARGLRVAYRNNQEPTQRYHGFGFRCAASPGM